MGLRGLKPSYVVAGAALLLLVVGASGGDDAPKKPGIDPVPPPPNDDDDEDGFDAFGVRYAKGDSSPAWPLDDAKRSITGDFGDDRDDGVRRHVGEDLIADRGTLIRATEDGVVVEARDTWYEGSGVLLVQTDSGIVVAYGEIEPGSFAELGVVEGSRVARGDPLARVGRHDQLHFETYVKGTKETHRWMAGEPPPASILDPTLYLRAAAQN